MKKTAAQKKKAEHNLKLEKAKTKVLDLVLELLDSKELEMRVKGADMILNKVLASKKAVDMVQEITDSRKEVIVEDKGTAKALKGALRVNEPSKN